MAGSSTKRRERRGPDSTRINANQTNPRGFVLLRHPVWSLAQQSAKIRSIREDSCSPPKNARASFERDQHRSIEKMRVGI